MGDSLDDAPGRIARQAFLRERLSALTPADIVEFRTHLDRSCARAYSWDLVGAAQRIFGGWLSEDGFAYFRLWLVGRGRLVFDQAVTQPDSLAELAEIRCLAGRHFSTWDSDTEWPEWETLAYVAIDAYEQVTGDDDERADAFYAALKVQRAEESVARSPRGRCWDACDDAAAAARTPKLATMFPLDTSDRTRSGQGETGTLR